MSTKPEPVPQLAAVSPYVPGEAPKHHGGPSYKLASNENPLGCSPKAREAALRYAAHLETYPDGAAQELRKAIARRHGLDASRVICGSGSDEIFMMLARAYLSPGDEVIVTEHAFSMFAIVSKQAGADVVVTKERALTADVDAMLAAVTPRTKIVWLANPNNPTGTYLTHAEVNRLHAGLPASVILVLDGAYAEFCRRNDFSGGVELASAHDNVIITRTFSKLHGLAGLRVGWGYAPPHMIDALERVRMPFNVNLLAEHAAMAAIEDDAFIERSLAHNDAELKRLGNGLRALGLVVGDSACNFLLAHFPDVPGRTAREAFEHLKARGITVRGMAGYGLPHALRISIGTVEAGDALLAGLGDFLGGA